MVGAGFAGMYMLHRLRQQGMTARVYEQGDGVGGTWYWNRYPGARCDVESMQYSYSFSDELQQEWDWSERYAPQPEILKYANHVADRFDLRSDIQFNTRVEQAVFDENASLWSVTTSDGKTVDAQNSSCSPPVACRTQKCPTSRVSIASRARFTTPVTGRMRRSISPASASASSAPARRRSSRCPIIAEQASQLTVFQRTANFSIPARNAALTEEERQSFRARYPEIRQFAREVARNGIYTEVPDRGALDDGDNERRSKYEARWNRGGLTFMSVYNNLGLDKTANDTAANFVREKIARDRRGSGRPQSCCSRTAIRSARSASASTPIISRPSTARMWPWSTSSRTRSRRSPNTRCAPAARTTRSMRWCSPPASTP